MRIFINITLLFFFINPLYASAEQTGLLQVYLFKGEKVPEQSYIYLKGEQKIEKISVFEGFVELKRKPGVIEVALKKRGPYFSIRLFESKVSHISFDLDSSDELLSKYDNHKKESELSKNKHCFIEGRVTSFETGESLESVSVFVAGSQNQTKTKSGGYFKIEAYNGANLSFVHTNHRVKIKESSSCDSSMTIELMPSMGEMEEVVVLKPSGKGSVEDLLKERKSSKSVSVFIGSDEFKKNGDSNAASALKRVSGLSLVDGRYVYIRGLGERYSSTNLNGANLPSPNPSRRVVPLDLFPTSLIESISIQKSYSVDKPAQFSAGLVEIRTLSIPKKNFINFSLSTGASSEQALKGEEMGFVTENGGSSDLLGFDDGTRSLPDAIQNVRDKNLPIKFKDPNDWFGDGTGFTADELSELGTSFSDDYSYEDNKIGPNAGMSLAMGGALKRGVHRIGGVFKGVYKLTQDYEEQVGRTFILSSEEAGLRLQDEAKRRETSQRYNLGGQTSVGVDVFKNHEIDFTFLATRSTLNNNEIIENNAIANDEESFRTFRSFWEERELRTEQVKGKHKIFSDSDRLNLNWMWAQSNSSRYRPDEREYLYYLNSGTFVDRSFGNQRIYSDLNDRAQEFKFKLSTEFSINRWWELSSFAGFRDFSKNRISQTQRFTFNRIGSGGDYSLSDSATQILSHENIQSQEFRLIDSTLPTDNYKASEENGAGFFNLTSTFNFNESSRLSLISGLRYEDHYQDVNAFDIVTEEAADETSTVEQAKTFYNFGAVYSLNNKSSFTLAYSETVSRPDLQEFAPVVYYNDVENTLEIGNPDLEISEVTNFDLRYDYYMNSREFLSVGYFRKDIKSPIESVQVVGTEDAVTFENIEMAFNDGFEFEFRKHLYRNLFLSGNYSYISSRVELNQDSDVANTSENRPLQGQSPYLVNLSMEYSARSIGLNTALTFNMAGKRIAQVGAFGTPDIYEEPFERLDFTLRKEINKKQALSFKVQNILNPEAQRTQGDQITRSFERGTRFSLGFSTQI